MSFLLDLPVELRSQHIIYKLPIKEVFALSSISKEFQQLTEEAAQLAGFAGCKEMGQTASLFSRILPMLQMHGFCSDGAAWEEVSLGQAARAVWWIRRKSEEFSEDPLYKVIRAMMTLFSRERGQAIPSFFAKDFLQNKTASMDRLLQEKNLAAQSEQFLQLPKEVKCDPEIALTYLGSLLHSPVVCMIIRYSCAFAANPLDVGSWEGALRRVDMHYGTELVELFHVYQVRSRLQAVLSMFSDNDVSHCLKENPVFMQAACLLNGWLLAFASDAIKNSQQVALVALGQNPYAIRCIDQGLREDKKVVQACVKSYPCRSISLDSGWILQEPLVNPLVFAGEVAKNDFYTVLLAVRRYGPQALLQANSRFFNNRYMLKACLTAGFCEEEGVVLFVRSDLLKTDKILMRQFAKVYPQSLSRCYRFLPSYMQKDPELLRQLPWYQRWFVARR